MAYTRKNKNALQKGNNNKPKRVVRNFYLNGGNTIGNDREYDRNSLLDILDVIPFRQISIPVYLHRGYLGDDQNKGYLNVGYILSYNPEEEKFGVVIKNKYEELVDGLGDAIIYVRAAVNADNTVRNIIALDIEAVYTDEEESSGEDEEEPTTEEE